MLLAYKGVALELAPPSSEVYPLFKTDDVDMSGAGTNAFAPPYLHDVNTDLWVSQTPAIVSHLARKHELLPKDSDLICIAEKCLNDCQDLLAEITRHNGSTLWTDREEFKACFSPGGRIYKWLLILEATAARHGSLTADSGFFVGDTATFADTSVCACLGNMKRCLPQLGPWLMTGAPMVMALVDRMMATSGVSALYRDQAITPYCGGFIEESIRAVLPEEEEEEEEEEGPYGFLGKRQGTNQSPGAIVM